MIQLFGDSRTFDFSQYFHEIDVVFIDGDHGYQTVLSDSWQAFGMVSDAGIVIWDDYHPAYGPGVMKALGELSEKRQIAWVLGTRLAIYQNGLSG